MRDTETQRENGLNRAKQEYILLSCLDECGGALEFGELQSELATALEHFEQQDEPLPIYFTPSTGPDDFESRSLLRTLNRCRSSHRIRKNGNGFELTSLGRDVLSKIDADQLSADFKALVSASFANRDRVRV